jgi:hypothetical protein
LKAACLRVFSLVLDSSRSRNFRFFQARKVSSVTFVCFGPKAARSFSTKSSKEISSFLSSFFLS